MPKRPPHSPAERWMVGLFFYLLLFNYPFILVFNATRTVFGIPLLFLYLMGGWLIAIVLVALFIRRVGMEATQKGEGDET